MLNKDQELSELKQRFHQQSEEMSQVVTESKQKQDQISELMQQLSISETKCNSLQEDLLSLNGQLAEVNLIDQNNNYFSDHVHLLCVHVGVAYVYACLFFGLH